MNGIDKDAFLREEKWKNSQTTYNMTLDGGSVVFKSAITLMCQNRPNNFL